MYIFAEYESQKCGLLVKSILLFSARSHYRCGGRMKLNYQVMIKHKKQSSRPKVAGCKSLSNDEVSWNESVALEGG